MVVVPFGNNANALGGKSKIITNGLDDLVNDFIPHASVGVGIVQLCNWLQDPEDVLTVVFAGHVMEGGVVSIFTVADDNGDPVDIQPLPSVILVKLNVVFELTTGPVNATPLVILGYVTPLITSSNRLEPAVAVNVNVAVAPLHIGLTAVRVPVGKTLTVTVADPETLAVQPLTSVTLTGVYIVVEPGETLISSPLL
jgi:hypothetical protein